MDRISKPGFDGPSPGPVGPSPACLEAHLKTLYALSQYSPHVFASPLGPFQIGSRHAYVPRFMFFGPRASDESWRLSFLAGFDHRDLRASQALLALAGRLAEDAEAGHGFGDGPLSAAEDLPFSPFELTIRVPSEWTGEAYRHAVTTLLARFLKRYRAFQAYGQNL